MKSKDGFVGIPLERSMFLRLDLFPGNKYPSPFVRMCKMIGSASASSLAKPANQTLSRSARS